MRFLLCGQNQSPLQLVLISLRRKLGQPQLDVYFVYFVDNVYFVLYSWAYFSIASLNKLLNRFLTSPFSFLKELFAFILCD